MSLSHWEAYYRGGGIATCPTAADGTYDRELKQVWLDTLADLPDGGVILDVATGNGPLVLIAAEQAAALGRHWEIHGTDLAQIDPVAHVPDGKRRFTGCRFHPGVATEKLPFPDASFDVVCGQYALEYADPRAGLGEIARVLRAGCSARFILHHASSLLVQKARSSLQQSDLVLRETRLYRHLRRLVEQDNHSPRLDDPATLALRTAIRQLRSEFEAVRASGHGHVLGVTLDAVRELLSMRTRQSAGEVVREVDRVERELRQSVHRLRDLLEHALDDQRMDALLGEASRAGLAVTERAQQYYAGDNLVGWRIRLRKDGGS